MNLNNKIYYKYFFVLLFFLIILHSLFHTKECFESNIISDKCIVLLGDSILKNDRYVKHGESVSDWLKHKSYHQCKTFAIDGSKILNVYTQLSNIPSQWNNKNTTFFISVGGNDILELLNTTQTPNGIDKKINEIFNEYIVLIDYIKKHWSDVNILLLNLYCPLTMLNVCPIVNKWNQLQSQYANNKNIRIINIDANKENIQGIEPTSQGGKKIVEQILQHI